jgi:hypothetical protein
MLSRYLVSGFVLHIDFNGMFNDFSQSIPLLSWKQYAVHSPRSQGNQYVSQMKQL